MPRKSFGPLCLDVADKRTVYNAINGILTTKTPSQVVTLNALMFNQIMNTPSLAQAVNNAALILPDSHGIVWAARFLFGGTIHRFPGIDLIEYFCSLSESHGYTIFLLGAQPGVPEKAARNLSTKYPHIRIVGTHHGFFKDNVEVIAHIKSLHPDILLVGLDIPRQEVWISHNLAALNVPIVIGVGGSFDVLSGNLKRAPNMIQYLGLEWFFRFLQQPWRIVRLFGLPLFIWNILKLKGSKTNI